jgi:hypothetical protein
LTAPLPPDGALALAWLGRGLINIRRGAVLEGAPTCRWPPRWNPAGSLAKLSGQGLQPYTRRPHCAPKELTLARKLDPNDPTSWLYSALLNEQENRVNEAVKDLERSKDLNDNRSLFRSRLLLDQDQAVRSAKLAAIHRDAGMTDFSVGMLVNLITNYSAHLFLANSYDAVRDPKPINLRCETPAFSELLGPTTRPRWRQPVAKCLTSKNTHSSSMPIISALSSRNTPTMATGCARIPWRVRILKARSVTTKGRKSHDRAASSNNGLSLTFKHQLTPRTACSSRSAASTPNRATWLSITIRTGTYRESRPRAWRCGSQKSRSPTFWSAITANGRRAATPCSSAAGSKTRSLWRTEP